MQTPPRLLLLLLGVQILCFAFVFISLLSDSWLKVEEGAETWHFGIYESCYVITGQSETIHGKSYSAKCSYCASTTDEMFFGDITFAGLKGAKAFAAFTFIAVILATMLIAGHVCCMLLEFDRISMQFLFIMDGVMSVVQWVLMTITLICISVFMKQIDYIYFQSGTVDVEKMDFGYGKVMSWITWLCFFGPIGISGFMLFLAYKGQLDSSGRRPDNSGSTHNANKPTGPPSYDTPSAGVDNGGYSYQIN